jgi:hypothetical protein
MLIEPLYLSYALRTKNWEAKMKRASIGAFIDKNAEKKLKLGKKDLQNTSLR